MVDCEICTSKYDVDLCRLLSRRLAAYPNAFSLTENGGGARVFVDGADSLNVLCDALSILICRDLIYFELARMADILPLNLTEKQAVLTETLRTCRDHAAEAAVREGLTGYLSGCRRLNLEGYILFRMQKQISDWRTLVERAAQEQLMHREYAELLNVLNAFVEMQQPRIGEIAVCLNPDGSCTLTDDSDARIEYVDCSEDGIVGLLVSMAPARLTVYDLSGGTGRRLADAIAQVFTGRVKIYR